MRERERGEKKGGREKFRRKVWNNKEREEFRDKLGNEEKCGGEMETGKKM